MKFVYMRPSHNILHHRGAGGRGRLASGYWLPGSAHRDGHRQEGLHAWQAQPPHDADGRPSHLFQLPCGVWAWEEPPKEGLRSRGVTFLWLGRDAFSDGNYGLHTNAGAGTEGRGFGCGFALPNRDLE